VKASKICLPIGLSALLILAPVADAQRTSAGPFAGNWKGTLTMGTIIDVEPADRERLSKPVDLEIRIEGRGGAELYFTFEENEWEFTNQRGFRITPIPGANGVVQNGVIEARIPGNVGWTSGITLNLAVIDETTLFLSWSRLTVRDNFLYDGLDEFGFAGTATLTRISD
jgi:hypothetical protein